VLGMSIRVTIVGSGTVIPMKNAGNETKFSCPTRELKAGANTNVCVLCGDRKNEMKVKDEDYVLKEFIA
jgi:hypothetical protein